VRVQVSARVNVRVGLDPSLSCLYLASVIVLSVSLSLCPHKHGRRHCERL
jgi:hypothetical protein